MAGESVEILIRARNEANSAIAQAIGQLKVLENQGVRAGAAPRLQLVRLTDALSTVSPRAAQAASEIARFAALGPVVGGVAAAVVGIGAAFVATLAAAKKFSSEVERLGNLKAATGASIENLQVLGEVFRRAGLGAEAADASMLRLNKAIAEQNPLLAKLGITARDPVEALIQLSRAFASSSDQAAKTKIAFELMGRGSGDVLKVIDALAASFPELRSEMIATGQVFSEDAVEAGKKFDAAWDKFTGRWEGFMARIGGAAAVAANAVIDAFAVNTAATPLEKKLADAQQLLATFRRDSAKFGVSDFGKLAQLEKAVATLTQELAKSRDQVREFERELPIFGVEGKKAADLVANAMDGIGKKTKAVGDPLAALVKQMEAFSAAQEFDPARVRLLAVALVEGRLSMEGLARAAGQAKVALDVLGQANAIKLARDYQSGALSLEQLTKALGSAEAAQKALVLAGSPLVQNFEAAVRAAGGLAPVLDRLASNAGTKELSELFDKAAKFEGAAIPERRGVGPLPVLIDEKVPEIKAVFSPGIDAMADFEKALDDLADTSLARVDLIAGAFSGLSSGLTAAFQGLVAGTLTLKAAIVGVVKSMVDEILAALARLVAARIFKLFLQLTGLGAPIGAFGIADISGGGGFIGPPAPALAGGAAGTFSLAPMDNLSSSIQALTTRLDRMAGNTVRVDRRTLEDTLGAAMSEKDRRQAMRQGF